MGEWPKEVVVYVHGDKESNWEKGKEIGLSERAIASNFKYCLLELRVLLKVNEDGTYEIVDTKE